MNLVLVVPLGTKEDFEDPEMFYTQNLSVLSYISSHTENYKALSEPSVAP